MNIFEEFIRKIGREADNRHIITDLQEFYEVLKAAQKEAEAKVKAAIEKLKENHEGERIVDCKGTTDKTSVTGESGCALPTYSYTQALDDILTELFGD